MFYITFKSTRERVKPSVSQKEIPFKQGLGALFRNKYWGIMLMFAVIVYTNNGMTATQHLLRTIFAEGCWIAGYSQLCRIDSNCNWFVLDCSDY